MVEISPVDPKTRVWIEQQQLRLFGGEMVISRGVAHWPLALDGFVARRDGREVGLATYRKDGAQCELVTLDALEQWQGIGTALLARVEAAARAAGATRLWLVTTNDNTDALRFYQRRGFVLVAVHAGAVEHSRTLKPSIPRIGNHGIEIRDELELEKSLVAKKEADA